MKTEKTSAPDYEGTIKFHKDRYDSFRLWIDGSQQAVFLKDGTYYKLSKNDTKALLNIMKKEAKIENEKAKLAASLFHFIGAKYLLAPF